MPAGRPTWPETSEWTTYEARLPLWFGYVWVEESGVKKYLKTGQRMVVLYGYMGGRVESSCNCQVVWVNVARG